MPKITSSVNLEKDIWDEIEAYKKQYQLSSRNVALERMLLERRIYMQGLPSKPPEQEKENKTEIKKNTAIENSIKDSFSNMK